MDPATAARKSPTPDPSLESQAEEDDPPFRTPAPPFPLSRAVQGTKAWNVRQPFFLWHA
jgi:hypothetical protein